MPEKLILDFKAPKLIWFDGVSEEFNLSVVLRCSKTGRCARKGCQSCTDMQVLDETDRKHSNVHQGKKGFMLVVVPACSFSFSLHCER